MTQVKIDAQKLYDTYKTQDIFAAYNEYDAIIKEKKLKFFEAVALKQEFMKLYKTNA